MAVATRRPLNVGGLGGRRGACAAAPAGIPRSVDRPRRLRRDSPSRQFELARGRRVPRARRPPPKTRFGSPDVFSSPAMPPGCIAPRRGSACQHPTASDPRSLGLSAEQLVGEISSDPVGRCLSRVPTHSENRFVSPGLGVRVAEQRFRRPRTILLPPGRSDRSRSHYCACPI